MTAGWPWNPVLAPLALLAAVLPLAAWWWKSRGGGDGGDGGWRVWLGDLAVAWAAVGVAAMALLAPVLAQPGGVPSPAAALAGLPPWQQAPALGAAAAPAGNPLLRDVTFQIQPWLLFARGELRAGRLPGWNPHQFAGAPFWSNGQSAPLFPLHLLFAALPLQAGLVLLPWLRLVTAGCGAWALGRQLGLSRPAALLAALAFALSGMLVSFALFPMGNALALVPWVLWAVERLAGADGAAAPAAPATHATPATLAIGGGGAAPGTARRRAFVVLAAVVGVQLLGGHPETVAHTALLSFLYLAVRGMGRPLASWLAWAGAWLTGAALAGAQLLPLALALPETARWQAMAVAPAGAVAGSPDRGGEPPFGLLLEQPLRLVLPELYGHPARGTWWGPFNYSATAVYAGALALPLAAAGLARCRRDRRWLALAVAAGFAFVAAYHWPVVRTLLAAVPVLGRAAQHRLLFGVELGLALLAGAGLDEWLAGRGRGVVAGGALVLALLAVAWTLHRSAWAARGLVSTQAGWTAAAAAAALLLPLSLLLGRERRWLLAPLLPALAAVDLIAAHGAVNPALPLADLYPRTGAVRFLAGRAGRVAGTGQALRPNAAMVYGLYDVRGDDPVKMAAYEAVYARIAAGDPVYFQPVTHWESPWLDLLGVRWVLAAPGEPPAAAGWRLAYAGADARVYERPTALPLVRWEGGLDVAAAPEAPAAVSGGGPGTSTADAAAEVDWAAAAPAPPASLVVEGRAPGRWRIAWRTAARRRVLVAENWDPGWRAALDGRQVPVGKADQTLLAVPVGPGSGRLDLCYRAPGLAAGACLSLAALALLAALWWPARAGRTMAPLAAPPVAAPARAGDAAA